MAKKKSRKRRSAGGPTGKPGAATKAQAKQSQKAGTSGPKTRKGTKPDSKQPRSVFDVAKGTSQAQRITIATVIVVVAAVAGLVAGRSAGSNPGRYNDESAAVDAARDSGDFDLAPGTATQLPAGETGPICVPDSEGTSPTQGTCGSPPPASGESEAGTTETTAAE